MSKIRKIILLFYCLITVSAFAQPRLEITPGEIEFENIFSRLENVYFINTGDKTLRIDSIVYNYDIYFVRFDKAYINPFYLEPGDSAMMDCILAGYYYIPSSDTLDTMYVYSNSQDGEEVIRVKIKYYDDNFGWGTINGLVTDGADPVSGARVHFFYEGNYMIRSVLTDQSGFYSANLPPGPYKAAAEKDSFYVTFFGQQFDPINAEFIPLDVDSVKTANISLLRKVSTPNSVSGFITDSLSGATLRRGIVIIKKGIHSPSKIVGDLQGTIPASYTAFIEEDGSYSVDNIIEPAQYYIQSFSDYFVPAYYKSDISQVFWQSADSVFINSPLINYNISMMRDSSTGGGNVQGKVIVNSSTPEDTVSDVIIYAQPAENDSIFFNYAFTTSSGDFNIPFLPYGDYRLVAQKLGYNDGFSIFFTIDSVNSKIGNLNITISPLSVSEDPSVPVEHVLLFNYPNPFNPLTTIGFILPFSTNVEIIIYNLLGEKIRTLLSDYLTAGKYEIGFNAEGLTSGTYFVALKTAEGITSRKILLLR